MIRFNHTRLAAGVLLGVGALLAPLAATSGQALASTPSPNTPTQVPSGVSAADLPGAGVLGSTPVTQGVTVSFVLKEQNESSLQSAVEAGIQESNYLSVGQFASQYGQPKANIDALTSYLAGYGISTDVYADDVDVVATGTAGEFDKALTVQEQNYYVPQQSGSGNAFGPVRAQTVYSNSQPPLLPYHLASFVTAILGLSDYAPYGSQTAHVDTKLLTPQPSSSNSCLALTGLPDACNLPQNFAANYGLDGLYSRHADGSGQTLAIVTLATVDPGPTGYAYAPQYYWAKVADINRTGSLTVENIDGGSGAPSSAAGSGETDLDIEQSGGLAPGANVVVYQAPNTDYGFADAFFTAASQNIASTVSASWLESETYLEASILNDQEAAGYNAAFDEAFLEMAAQGQSGFIASGDWGAYTATADIGTTNLSIGSNADSPFITAAGGTTLPWSGTLTGTAGSATVTVPAQRIWGWDYLWQPVATVTGESLVDSAESQVIGSGGGFSVLEPRPSYQQSLSGGFQAVPYLTPIDYVTYAPGLNEPVGWNFNPTPRVISGSGSGRMDPDLATDADPYSGYLLYAPSNSPALEGGWGGTSFVAPQLNGSTAVIDSYLGHRVGLWNPTIYAAAVSSNSPFTPLNQVGTGNDNIYYTGNPGEPYNQGAGLGYPNLTALASFFH